MYCPYYNTYSARQADTDYTYSDKKDNSVSGNSLADLELVEWVELAELFE